MTSTVKLRIPPTTTSANRRGPQYVSTASAGIGLSAYLATTPAPAGPQLVGALGPPYCVPQTDGSKLCSFPLPAPVGNDIVDVTLYDTAPTAAGMVQGHVLSHVRAPETILQNAVNTLQLTMNGVVASVQFSGGQWVVNGSQTQFVANVATYDASNEVIVGAYDQPVLLSISGDGAAHLTISKGATLSSPADNQLVVTWDGTPFTSASIGLTVGGNPGTSAFALPIPGAIAQVPFVIPPASRGDLAFGVDSIPGIESAFDSGFYVVTASAPSTITSLLSPPGYLYVSPNEDQDSDVLVAALPDNSVAAAYNAGSLFSGEGGNSNAVEVDVAFSHGTTQLDGIGHTFFTDMCELNGAASDGAGNLALLGDTEQNCGISPGRPVTIQLDSAARRGLGRRHAAASRRASGTRHTLQTTDYVIEVFASPLAAPAYTGVAPARRIVDANLSNAVEAFAADGQGRFYAIDNANEGQSFNLDIYDVGAAIGATARVPIAASQSIGYVNSVGGLAVDNLGRIAVLFNGEGLSGIQLYRPYPAVVAQSAPLATVTWNPFTVGNAEPFAMTFDRFNNLWVVADTDGPAALYAFAPFPVTIPGGYTTSPGAVTSLSAGLYAITAFPKAISQSQPVLPVPTPTPCSDC